MAMSISKAELPEVAGSVMPVTAPRIDPKAKMSVKRGQERASSPPRPVDNPRLGAKE
jgi:hypothetical protein